MGDNVEERWLKHHIVDLYEGSDQGNIRHCNTSYVLNPNSTINGYLRISVRGVNHPKQKSIDVQRFIYSCFHPEFDLKSKLQINHKNRNKKDNSLENLEPSTKSENIRHSLVNRDMNKLRSGKVIQIKLINKETQEEHIFKSKSAAGRFVGKSAGMVFHVLNKTKYCNDLKNRICNLVS